MINTSNFSSIKIYILKIVYKDTNLDDEMGIKDTDFVPQKIFINFVSLSLTQK